jgi:hypothetical protein
MKQYLAMMGKILRNEREGMTRIMQQDSAMQQYTRHFWWSFTFAGFIKVIGLLLLLLLSGCSNPLSSDQMQPTTPPTVSSSETPATSAVIQKTTNVTVTSSASENTASASVGPTTNAARPSVPVQLRTIYPEKLDGYIPNPYMGWQDTLVEGKRFPETVGFVRNNWSTFHPAPDEYDWSEIEKLRERMTKTGGKISFRIQTVKPPPWGTGHGIPDWLVATGAMTVEGSVTSEPVYAGCLFLEEHGKFIDVLRQQYDGDPDVAFIDVGSYGLYGEWHSEQYEWDNEGGLDWSARRRIIDMYLGGEGTRPCLTTEGETINATYAYSGFQKTQLVMPYTPGFSDSVRYAFSKRQDLGIRHDALGSEKHQNLYREEISDLIEQTWPHEPIIFEFYPKAYPDDRLRSARDFAEEMHASYIHENFDDRGNTQLIERILEKVGYRLVLRQVSYTPELHPGGTIQVNMFWENTGVAPPYVQYPLVVLLVDHSSGEIIMEQEIETDIRKWLPDKPVSLKTTLTVPPSLEKGLFDLKLAFVDPDSREPAISLAIAGEDPQGYFLVGAVNVLP